MCLCENHGFFVLCPREVLGTACHLAALILEEMLVEIHREGDRVVSKDLAERFGVYPGGAGKAGEAMPQLVKGQTFNPRFGDDRLVHGGEGGAVKRVAVPRGENQSVFTPPFAGVGALKRLVFAPVFQRSGDAARDRDAAPRARRLRSVHVEAAARLPADALPDVNLEPFGVEVLPAQPENLAAADAGGEDEQEQCLEPESGGGAEVSASLILRVALLFGFDLLRCGHAGGGVACDHLQPGGEFERGFEDAMQAEDFKLANARFSLEEYEAAGGMLETDLWNSAEGTRLRSREVIERLQTAWAERQLEELKARGFAFAELRSGAWTWWSEFNRAARDAEGVGAVVHIRQDWAVDVIEGIVPNQPATGTNGVSSNSTISTTSSGGFTTDPSTGITTKLEEPKTEHSEAGITLVRRLRTAALQQAILENGDAKLPLALAVLGFLGEREVRFGVKYLGETDALASKTILAELEAFAARLPHVGFSPTHGLEFSVTGRHDASRCLETLNALLNLPKSDLERLHRLLVATMIGDFVSATDGAFQERKRSLKVSGVIAGLAAHLGVKGGEAWEIGEDYLKTISFRKARLEPYLAAALGEMLARALMDNPKAKIIAEVLAHKAKIPGDFTPPELEFSRHANPVAVKLEVGQDDFDDELEELGEHAGLISEDDLGFVTTLEETELDEDAAD